MEISVNRIIIAGFERPLHLRLKVFKKFEKYLQRFETGKSRSGPNSVEVKTG